MSLLKKWLCEFNALLLSHLSQCIQNNVMRWSWCVMSSVVVSEHLSPVPLPHHRLSDLRFTWAVLYWIWFKKIISVTVQVKVLWPPQLNWSWVAAFFLWFIFFTFAQLSFCCCINHVCVLSANLFPTPTDLSFPSHMPTLSGQVFAWKCSSCSLWSIQRARTLHIKSPTD